MAATLAAVALVSCGDSQSSAESQLDENLFIQIAQQATCADKKNKLYEIDRMMVLSDRAGSCPDASFSQILYGTNPDDVHCRNQDTIAGPKLSCDSDPYRSIFETMIANLSQADLGLGPTHSVKILLK